MTDTTAILDLLDEDGSSTPEAQFVVVTPDRAARWLDRNTRNRRLRARTLDRYTRDMENGRWHMDGSPIRFAKDGTLLDGQHRLAAVVKSGLSQKMLVVVGLVPEAQSVMDTGPARSAADALTMDGYSPTTTVALAAGAKLAIEFERGDYSHNQEVSHSDIIAFIDAHPLLLWAVEQMRPLRNKADCAPAIITYSLFRFAEINKVEALIFWHDVVEKVNLPANDPALTLGQRLATARRNAERIDRTSLVAMIFRAWNYRRTGETIGHLKATSGEIPTLR